MPVNLITLFIKTIMINLCIYYSASKITNKMIPKKSHIIFIVYNILISLGYTYLKPKTSTILLPLGIYFLFSIVLSKITNNKVGYSLIIVLISYAISYVALMIGTLIGFVLYKLILNENEILGTISSSLLQIILISIFFKIKRFRNGFEVIYKKFNTDVVDNIVIYVGICIMLIACFMGCVFFEPEDIMKNTVITFIILGITMYIMIQRTLTMQYKHSLLLKTLEEYKEEIDVKNKEIEKLSAEKFNTSKIRHEFYNRQKALELMVKQNMNTDVDKSGAGENILNIVDELTKEYSKECEIIKGLNVLPKTNITEIDNMFKYMQTECAKNNIDFKLNIQDSVEPLINQYISKSRLETLLGDHIRDAINAVNKSDSSNKEILVVLGLKDGVYEICILDNGVEFGIDTLLRLGKEQVTTGGTGIGFLTTFETLKETKASLVITEFDSSEYTKSVAFVFNNECEYVVNSYRAESIREKCNREDIIINKNEG